MRNLIVFYHKGRHPANILQGVLRHEEKEIKKERAIHQRTQIL